MTVRIIEGDALAELPRLAAEGLQAHAVVCDPPYELGFMGHGWDKAGVAFRPETWRLVLDAMRPGAHLLAFGGSRTSHRMTCAIEDAGFEIRDTVMWLYGTGFPKSHDVSKAIDKAAGMERAIIGPDPQAARRNKATSKFGAVYGAIDDAETCPLTAPATLHAAAWQGWGTALKPAFEPIVVARKPLDGTVVANVLAHGTGALNIEASRVPRRIPEELRDACEDQARWPANVLHDGSPEVEAAFAAFGLRTSGAKSGQRRSRPKFSGVYNHYAGGTERAHAGDTGSAARFFFSAKAGAEDRAGSDHPTVKPTALMRWLVTLVCPPGGLVLDPFAGTGSTGLAADQLGMDAVLIERDATYAADARRKIERNGGLFTTVTAA